METKHDYELNRSHQSVSYGSQTSTTLPLDTLKGSILDAMIHTQHPHHKKTIYAKFPAGSPTPVLFPHLPALDHMDREGARKQAGQIIDLSTKALQFSLPKQASPAF